MTTTPTASVAATIAVDVAADNALAARLKHPRADVASALRVALEKGLAIKATRIRYQEDLDEARAAKLKWTTATIELLAALFDNTSVADYCNDWVGKIFPEYAEFGNFVEQFYEEMEHRVGKLRSVLQRVEQVPDATAAANAAPTPTGHVPAAANAAPVAAAPAGAPMVAAGLVIHPAAPVIVPHVLLLGAPAADPTHSAAAELLKRLNVAAKPAEDPLAAGATDAAVFVGPSQPSDPAAVRVALFALGCAVGRLGAKRVCVLLATGATPFPETGVAHVAVDASGGWHLPLLRHLKQAGMDVDLNKLC